MNTEAILKMIQRRQTPTLKGAQPSLRSIALEVDVPVSTFTRLSQGKPMSGPALVRILAWLHKDGTGWDYIMNRVSKCPPPHEKER